ncbi:MAG TPA: hypothetical protein VMI54_21670 [Polyangiaceae bacterium]|nr:hypothetical protein [Polyangiaceae bacterium]
MSTKAVISSLALVLLALLACKQAGPQPQTALDQPPVPPDAAAADAGDNADAAAPTDAITLECDGDAGPCYDQAKSRCPNGFDEVEKHEDTFTPPQGRAGKSAADLFKPKTPPPTPTTHTRLVVRCHAADGRAQ